MFITSGMNNYIIYAQQEQLNKLMSTLRSTAPHFVRCIVPNEFKKSGQWVKPLFLFHLLYLKLQKWVHSVKEGFGTVWCW